MSKSITILDKDYDQWVKTLIERYQQCQVRAAVKVNTEQLMYNYLLGRDIVEKHRLKEGNANGRGIVSHQFTVLQTFLSPLF